MVRYTTPTFTLTVSSSVDLTAASNVYATFAAGSNVLLTKTGVDLDVSEHQVDVFLTQEESALFRPGVIQIQLNWTYQVGSIVKRACSDIATINVKPNLLKGVVS